MLMPARHPMRAVPLALLLALLTGCGPLLSIATPTPPPTPSPSASPTPSPTPSPTASPSPAPTPGPALVPQLTVGGEAITNVPGLRVRSRPGMTQRVITSLGVDAGLLVAMGPVFIDGAGWYQVRDADAADPAFGEGWVAAGFEPDPYLISTSFEVRHNPFIAGYAGTANGEFGPALVGDGRYSLRWIAAPLDGDGCGFAVDMRSGSDDPEPVVRATVGLFPAPGDLFPEFFDAHHELSGDLFVTVTSDCSWAMSLVRAPRLRSGASD